MKYLDHLAGELVPVQDELTQTFWMENHVHGVIRNVGFHLVRLVKDLEQTSGGFIANPDVPMSIDDDPGVRLLLPKNEIERLAHMLQIISRQAPIAIRRHEACCHVQRIALLKRQIERTSKQLHHLAARLRASGFQKTQMPGRDICIACQFDLGEAANISPMLQQAAKVSGGDVVQDRILDGHGK
jgi:hypothetical protein